MKLLISESGDFDRTAMDRLRKHLTVRADDMQRRDLINALSDVDVLWIRLRHRIDQEVLQGAPRLKHLATATTGLNHIDLDACGRRGIQVHSLRGETEFLQDVRATAEHTVGLMLSLLRGIPSAVRHVQSGCWNRDRFVGRELRDKTVGIIGYGRLGRILARYLQAFDCRLLATDVSTSADAQQTFVKHVALDKLLVESDLVTMHASLHAGNEGFFGALEFAQMKPGAWFVNTARGELIDERALLEVLQSGKLAGAALDVLANEDSSGMAANPLVAYAASHDNLIITPHIGGNTRESRALTEQFMAGKLLAALGIAES